MPSHSCACHEPGQAATGESPTKLKASDVKINVTEFGRGKSW